MKVVRVGSVVRAVLLAALFAGNYIAPTRAALEFACEECYTCQVNGENRACCEDFMSGGLAGCKPHFDETHGWHCDGSNCEAE
jgi:hypothetical protein